MNTRESRDIHLRRAARQSASLGMVSRPQADAAHLALENPHATCGSRDTSATSRYERRIGNRGLPGLPGTIALYRATLLGDEPAERRARGFEAFAGSGFVSSGNGPGFHG